MALESSSLRLILGPLVRTATSAIYLHGSSLVATVTALSLTGSLGALANLIIDQPYSKLLSHTEGNLLARQHDDDDDLVNPRLTAQSSYDLANGHRPAV